MTSHYLLFAVLSGVSFALMGVAYRLGHPRHVHESHLFGLAAVAGGIVFTARALPTLRETPALVWGLAAFVGLTQAGVIHGVRLALRWGPLTPMWCVLMLNFVPVIGFTAIGYGEVPTRGQLLAIVAALGCVGFAATLSAPAAEEATAAAPRPTRHPLAYGLLLIGMLFICSLLNISMKFLALQQVGADSDLMRLHGDAFRAVLYWVIVLGTGADQLLHRRAIPNPRATLVLGALTAAGTIGGLWFIGRCLNAPTAAVFVAGTMASLVAAALAGALLFHERTTWRWFATVGCGLAAAGLASV